MEKRKSLFVMVLGLAILLAIPGFIMAAEQYVPCLIYRTGPFAPGGSGSGGGWEDFMTLANMKGGVNGIMYKFEECETAYDTARGVECYERVKPKNPAYIQPYSTGITYALLDRSAKDKIPLVFMGYGRADASDGRVFPWAFAFPTNYWSQNTAKIKFIAQKMGGMDKLKGLKIANLYIDVPYGQETRPLLEKMSKMFGFEVQHFPVPWPGIDQKAQWVDIVRRYKADWVINRNWGVSCTVPLKEAARLGFPRDRIIGVWWCGSEEDVLPAGPAAKGYIAANFNGVGQNFPIIQEILEKVYGGGKGNLSITRVGTVFYNRGVVQGIYLDEALRTAHKKFGVKVVTAEEMRWALENLDITEARLKEIGAEGLCPPIKTSWKDHEGGGWVRFQQWDGSKWVPVSGWIEPLRDFVRKEVEESAAKYAKEKGITPRTSEALP